MDKLPEHTRDQVDPANSVPSLKRRGGLGPRRPSRSWSAPASAHPPTRDCHDTSWSRSTTTRSRAWRTGSMVTSPVSHSNG